MRLSTKEALLSFSVVFLGAILNPVVLGVIFLPLLSDPWQGSRAAIPDPVQSPQGPEMTLEAFKVQQPQEPVRIRCDCKMETFNNDPYQYEIWATTFDTLVVCGIFKDSPAGKQIYEILKDGKKHKMTLKIRYNQGIGRYEIVEIVSLN